MRILWCLIALLSVPGTLPGTVYAVLVGIRTYRDDNWQRAWLRFADADAALFQGYLQERQFGPNVTVFTDLPTAQRPATKANVVSQLKTVLGHAGSGDQVYLFISARGHATRRLDDGYIDAYETQTQKRATTAIATSSLFRMVRDSLARVYIFADVSREEQVDGYDNRINHRLKDLLQIGERVEVILASEPARQSAESTKFSRGVYVHTLVEALRRFGPKATMDQVYEHLLEHAPGLSETRQKPHPRPRRPVLVFPALPAVPPVKVASLMPMWAQAGAQPQPRLQAAIASQTAALLRWVRSDKPHVQTGAPLIAAMLANFPTSPEPGSDIARRSALDEIAATLESEGQDVVARYGTGDQFPGDPAALTREDFQRAEAAFWAASRIRPGDLSLTARRLFCRGRWLLFEPHRPGDLEQAAMLLTASIESDREILRRDSEGPRNQSADALNALGIVRLEQKEFDGAASSFREAIRQAPDWSYPRHNLALTLAAQGRTSEAEREYREAIDRAPYYPYLSYNLGLLLQRENRLGPAEKEYLRAQRLIIEQATTLDRRAGIWDQQGKPDEARAARQRARRLRLHRAQVQNALGSVYEVRRKLIEAQRFYTAAGIQDPQFAVPHHNLAVMLSGAGRTKEAIASWETAVHRDNTFIPARIGLAGGYFASDRFDDAVREFQTVLKSSPNHFEARRGLAATLYRSGDLNRAIGEMKRSIADQVEHRSAPASASAYETLGFWLAERGDKREACRVFQDARSASRESPSRSGGRELRRQLSACQAAGFLPAQ